MPNIYVKVLGLDSDFDEVQLPDNGTVRDLKSVILNSKSSRLTGYTPADLKVYFAGSEPPDVDTPSSKVLPVYAPIQDGTPHFWVVPTSTLSVLTKQSGGSMPSGILPGGRESIQADAGPITGTLSETSQVRRMLKLKYDAPPPTLPPVELEVPVVQAPTAYRSKFGEHVARTATTDFFAKREQEIIAPEMRIGPINTTLLNQIHLNLDILDLPPRLETIERDLPIPKPAPGQSTRFATFVGEAIADNAFLSDIVVPPKQEVSFEPGVDLAATHGGGVMRNTLHRLRTARPILEEHDDEDFVWIADGTASSGKEFHGVPWDEIETYCKTHTHCFESTRKNRFMRFYLDLDGYVPGGTQREFREIDKQICLHLYSIFARIGCVMTSSMYNADVHTIGPHGTTRKLYANKLSYRVTFRKVFGTRQAMDDYAVSVVLPRLQEELKDLCIVTQHMDAQQHAILASGRPYLIVDRWVYSIGDRMRMLGSSKDLVVRPFKLVGSVPFFDTIIAYIPEDAVQIYEYGRGPRVSIWDAK